jgi:small acid-soluble spore protein (thioredoxin-like protein)
MAKPDDRSDNLEKIAKNIGHTLKNMDEANDYLKAHGDVMSDEEKQQIRDKNQRRERTVSGLREEARDEASYSKTR